MSDAASPEARKRANDKWKAKNPRYHADYAARRRQEGYALIRAAKDVPCMDCGITWPYYVMDLDHVRGVKIANLGNLKQHSLKVIREEIAKCDPVCSNCHRIRTHERAAAATA